MLQLIRFFQKVGYEIIYATTATPSEFAHDLTDFDVQSHIILLNDSSFDDFLLKVMPNIVLFDRFMVEEQFGWRITQNCPEVVRILDTEDLHCLRDARKTAYKKGMPFQNEQLVSDVAKREIASIFRCDLTLMISEFEMKVLKEFFKVDNRLLFYLPILVDNEDVERNVALKSFEMRKDFVFIGNFLHEPNWNCMQVLKTEIWPELSKGLPLANLQIYGAYSSQKVMQLHNPKERFFINGRAENAEKIIEEARVLLAPIRFGAGIKGKLLEAMKCGTPTVTTEIGCEAMHGNLPWNGFVHDDNSDFIASAIRLYSDESVWNRAQQNGFEIVRQKFSDETFWENLHDSIKNLRKNIKEHRQQNFIGAMLQHHSMRSTYYMSKWIEEKNRQ